MEVAQRQKNNVISGFIEVSFWTHRR